jgi:hypothetical protein
MNKQTKEQRINPETIEAIIRDSLNDYLSGKMTAKHLCRTLKQQLHGNATKLSVRTVELLPDFEQLIDLITELHSPYIIDTRIQRYVIQKLAHTLADALTD